MLGELRRRAAGADVVSRIDQPAADLAGEWRTHLGVAQVDRGFLELRLHRANLTLRDLLLGGRLVKLLLADRAGFDGPLKAVGGHLGLRQLRFRLHQAGFRLIHRRHVGRLLDHEEKLVLLDRLAVLEQHLLEKAGNPRDQFGRAECGGIAGEIESLGDIALFGRGDRNLRRRRGDVGVLLLVAGGQQTGRDHRRREQAERSARLPAVPASSS